jgi:hypothetical protein
MVCEAVCERQNRPSLEEVPPSSPETPGLDELKKLMQHCWSHEPQERPSFSGELAISLAVGVGFSLLAGAFSQGEEDLLTHKSLCCLSDIKISKACSLVEDKMDVAVSKVSVLYHPALRTTLLWEGTQGSLGHSVTPHSYCLPFIPLLPTLAPEFLSNRLWTKK